MTTAAALMPSAAADAPARESEIRRDFAVFEDLVGMAEGFLSASHLPAAAACAEIAAGCAWRNHPGLFSSIRLERLLTEIGLKAIPARRDVVARPHPAEPRHVLHVMSKARRMGGDSRFACRWIQADGGRRHSIAVTTQLGEPIPDTFLEAASGAGGQVHAVDSGTTDPIVRARRLRHLAVSADLVVLHLYPDDVVPPLAFARKDGLPPVLFINHSDHTFWLGVNVSDLVVQLRRCSVPLSVNRRHVEPGRLGILPIPLPRVTRTLSRADAKAQLGLHPESVVLLSVGTSFKYEPAGGPGFVDVLLPIVAAHERAVLLVVGPRHTGDWAAAHDRTGGRIVPLGPRYDTATLFQAADVYLDSFPFTSPTAALEAGTYGLPLVAYCPRTGDARVLGPGAPGLDDSVWRLEEVGAYSESVSQLIGTPALRTELGDRTRRNIEHHHMGLRWVQQLEALYRLAYATPPRGPAVGLDQSEATELDAVINRLYAVGDQGIGRMIDRIVSPLPFLTRARILWRMPKVNRSFSLTTLFPALWRPPGWKTMRRLTRRRE